MTLSTPSERSPSERAASQHGELAEAIRSAARHQPSGRSQVSTSTSRTHVERERRDGAVPGPVTRVDTLTLDSTVGGDQPTTLQEPVLLLTPEQAARALAISRTGVYQLLRSGQLRSVKIGACRRVPRDALEIYIARLSAAALDGGEVGHQ